jgi:SAM-dependent methyltransferase
VIGSLVHFALEGARINALLVAALDLRLCDHLARGPATVAELARRAGISERGCQAVADGMVGCRLWRVDDGRYANTRLAEQWLLPASDDYVGDEHPALFRAWLPMFSRITSLVADGVPAYTADSPEMIDLWAELTPTLARKGRDVVRQAIAMLELGVGSPHLLDIGGGARATYSRALLELNPSASATQVDWPDINRDARSTIEAAGYAGRFRTLDGDFHETDFGAECFDVVVLSHIVHLEGPDSNREMLRRVARALRPGGSVAIADWIVADGRTGPASSLFFNLTMLLLSEEGKSYEREEIRQLLLDSGFEEPTFADSADWATLVIARRS